MTEPIIFNWDEIEDGSGFDLIPPGPYPVAITKVELKDSKQMIDSGGKEGYPYINVELTVQEGEFKGRKVWDIWSLHPKAIKIGLGRALPVFGVKMEGEGKYGTYAEMCGMLFPKLNGATAIAVIKHQAANDDYPASERVNAYKKNGAMATDAAGPTSLI